MRRKVASPDGREWVVQLVWWPRPSEGSRQSERFLAGRTRSSRSAAPVGGAIFDALHVLVWPVIFLLKVVFRRPWLIEAFVPGGAAMDGMAWRVRGFGPARNALGEIASAIGAGARRPNPAGAAEARYIPKYTRPTGFF